MRRNKENKRKRGGKFLERKRKIYGVGVKERKRQKDEKKRDQTEKRKRGEKHMKREENNVIEY